MGGAGAHTFKDAPKLFLPLSLAKRSEAHAPRESAERPSGQGGGGRRHMEGPPSSLLLNSLLKFRSC